MLDKFVNTYVHIRPIPQHIVLDTTNQYQLTIMHMTSYNVNLDSQQPLTTTRDLDSYINRQFADAVPTIYSLVRLAYSQTHQNKYHEEQCKA